MAPLLAFVDIFVESAHMDEVVQALAKLDNIEELYEVTGEFDIVTWSWLMILRSSEMF